MALIVDPTTANITWKTSTGSARCHAGAQMAVVHCTTGANLAAGDRIPAGKVNNFFAIEVEGTVFVEANANEFLIDPIQFGMVQVTELNRYEILYAGRTEREGSCRMDLLTGFSANPSLDVQRATGSNFDARIFDATMLTANLVQAPKRGFNITVPFGDHPNNTVPYTFQNTLTHATNFLAGFRRAQSFTIYFVMRDNPTAPVKILGSIDWFVRWQVEFTWVGRATKPSVILVDSMLNPGPFGFIAGPKGDADWDDIVFNRRGPPTNRQDDDIVNRIYNQRMFPLLQQSHLRPTNLRPDFFT